MMVKDVSDDRYLLCDGGVFRCYGSSRHRGSLYYKPAQCVFRNWKSNNVPFVSALAYCGYKTVPDRLCHDEAQRLLMSRLPGSFETHMLN